MTNPDIICPGQRAAFRRDPSATHYLRVVFDAYWTDAAPSTEIFFLQNYPFHTNEDACTEMETEIEALLNTHNNGRCTGVTFITDQGWEMTEANVTAAGWRVVERPASTAPATPTPTPAPTPTPTPSPAPATPTAPAAGNTGSATTTTP